MINKMLTACNQMGLPLGTK